MYQGMIQGIENLIRSQTEWRSKSLNLIASENVMSQRARAQAGSDFCHRYAEGHPGERYYRGTRCIDEIESGLKSNLKILFHCNHTEVRPISGTNANEAVFSRLLNPGDIVLASSIPAGGHISHHREGSVGKFTRNIIAFPLTPDGYHIAVDRTKDLIRQTRPRMIVLGKSLFLFPEPIGELSEVCREMGTLIVYDAAHVLGLIAGGRFQDPLTEGAFLMTASTHKTFFGSQRGLILSNMDDEYWRKIDRGAFPGSSSNHHLDTLAQMAICTYEMMEFGKAYADAVIENAKTLASALDRQGFDVEAKEFGFTESHQVAVTTERFGGGEQAAINLEMSDIIVNMNLLPHEPLSHHDHPAGVRLGVQEMTRYGMGKAEMERIAELIKEVIIDRKDVREEVNRLRADFQEVQYSYDWAGSKAARDHLSVLSGSSKGS